MPVKAPGPVTLQDRQGVFVHSFKCSICDLEFVVFSWRANRHRVGSTFCPGHPGHLGGGCRRGGVVMATTVDLGLIREVVNDTLAAINALDGTVIDDTTLGNKPNQARINRELLGLADQPQPRSSPGEERMLDRQGADLP